MRYAVPMVFGLVSALALVGCAIDPTQSTGEDVLAQLYERVEMPIGIQQVMTDDGPVFADDKGMTLYLWAGDSRAFCGTQLDPMPAASAAQKVLALSSPPCAAQFPPLLAQGDQLSVGDWKVITRPEGTRQWSYKDRAVHKSYKDRLPGDVNALFGAPVFSDGERSSFVVAQPLTIVPASLKISARHGAGIVATTGGRQVYLRPQSTDQSSKSATKANNEVSIDHRWSLVTASALTQPVGIWSLNESSEGTRYWAYKGQPLYVYAGDLDPDDIKGLGIDGAEPLILKPEPKAPRDVSVLRNLLGPVYTDKQGMTLYYFHCTNPNPAGRDAPSGPGYACDNWNDDPGFREMFCPDRERCAEMWRPFEAPTTAPVRGGVWSIAVIPDPARYPLRWVPVDHENAETPGAIRVWTYRGLPLYRSVYDRGPGQLWGHDYNLFSGAIWRALQASGEERSK